MKKKLVKKLGYFLQEISIQEIIDYCTAEGVTDPADMFFCVEPECAHDENPAYVIRTSNA